MEIPTTDALRTLPCRALVAYAVRAAERVAPVFALADIPDKGQHLLAIKRAIASANGYAAAGAELRANAAMAATRASNAAIRRTQFSDVAEAADNYFAGTGSAAGAKHEIRASFAALAAVAAHQCASSANQAAENAFDATERACHAALDEIEPVLSSDFEQLCNLEIDAEAFVEPGELGPMGPLWPDGDPEWYAVSKHTMYRLIAEEYQRVARNAHGAVATSLEFYLDSGCASQDAIRSVLEALNELHVAHGGLGFTFREDGVFVLADAEAQT